MNIETTTKKNGLLWITGFSSSGKTTISRKVKQALTVQGYQTIFLDGDDLRSIFGNSWGYDFKSRVELAHVYFRLCSNLCSQGYVVIISAIAMFDELGDWVKENIPNSMQIYLNVPQGERIIRDAKTKKLFVDKKPNDEFYDIPRNADLTINNYGGITPDEVASIIVNTFTEYEQQKLDRGRKPHWDSYYKTKAAPNSPSSYAQQVANQLESPREILEIGCGNGRDSAFFSAKGHQVTAIDRSESAIDYCKKEYKSFSGIFKVQTLSNTVTDNAENFDVIYCRFVIHAMPLNEELETLRNSFRLLKPNGLFFIECRSINDPLARQGEIISPTERIDGHYRRFIILDEFKDRLKKNGFDVIEEVESNGLSIYKDEDPVVIRVTAKKHRNY